MLLSCETASTPAPRLAAVLHTTGFVPSARIVYNVTDGDGLGSATARLASAQSALGSTTVTAPDLDEDFVTAQFATTGAMANFSWQLGYSADIGVDTSDVEHRVSGGVSFSF